MKNLTILTIFITISSFASPLFASDSEDLFQSLYSKRFIMGRDSLPLVKIGLTTGESKITVSSTDGVVVWPNGRSGLNISGSKSYEISLKKTVPAKVRYWVSIKSIASSNIKKIAKTSKVLGKYRPTKSEQGYMIAIGGKIFDTRRTLFSVGPFKTVRKARKIVKKYRKKFEGPFIHTEMVSLPSGELKAVSINGKTTLSGISVLLFTSKVNSPIQISIGGKISKYPGDIYVALGKDGKLAVINELPVETYLAGILPSELFPSAPMEALKSQAVAARGQVLAKMGKRHMADPFHLCSKVHCQVYRGLNNVYDRTTKAVKSTRGLVLFDKIGLPADTVYHSSSGGHSENNENVWGGEPKSYLRGRPDGNRWKFNGVKSLNSFILSPPFSFCHKGNRLFRWTETISKKRMNSLIRKKGIRGSVKKILVLKRGVSGRATSLKIITSRTKRIVNGELKIRRMFGGLRSSMFLLTQKSGNFIFTGGGYGHGVGMSQWGAINRAKKGQSFKKILSHYYYGTRLKKVY
jgi:SpoIID/LytB domain protein